MKDCVSVYDIDTLAKTLLELDLQRKIEIPPRLSRDVSYEKTLAAEYDKETIAAAKELIAKELYSNDDLAVLDNLARWNYRNSGDLLRATYGLIGTSVLSLLPTQNSNTYVKAKNTDSLDTQFLDESVWAIRRMIRMSVSTGPHEAKIPLREIGDSVKTLSHYSTESNSDNYDAEKKRLTRLLPTVLTTSAVTNDGDQMEFSAKLLIQMIRATAEYRQDDNFGRLRSFLNNTSHLSAMLRMFNVDTKHQSINRLASDVIDQINCTDRMLSANCVAANGLMQRMINGEVVYNDIMEVLKHQHRVMAVEVQSCIGLTAYMLSAARHRINENPDVKACMSRLLRYSGIGARYYNEITTKGQ